MSFEIKDSGERKVFASGMLKDAAGGNKTDYTTIIEGPMFDRWAEHLTKAKLKYPDSSLGVSNWTLATGPEEMLEARKAAFRHFRKWLKGDQDEDHAAAIMFQLNLYEFVKEKLDKKGPLAF